MKSICYFFVLLIFNYQVKAQFFGLLRKNPLNEYTNVFTKPHDDKYWVINQRDWGQTNSLMKDQILVYNHNLTLIDSLNLVKGFILSPYQPIRQNNSYFFSGIYYDTLVYPTIKARTVIIETDTNYKFAAYYPITNFASKAGWSKLIKINNNYFIGAYRNYPNNRITIFKLNSNFIKTDSIDFFSNLITLEKDFNNNLIVNTADVNVPCLNPNGGRLQKLVYDTNLVYRNCSIFDSLTTTTINYISTKIELFFLSSQVVPISNTRTFLFGSWKVGTAFGKAIEVGVFSIIDQNNKILKTNLITDSLNSFYIPVTCQFNSVNKNNVLVISIKGYNHSMSPFPQPQTTKIRVDMFDTLGNHIWAKMLGGNMYYYPRSIAPTKDGGIVIAGLRYDTTTVATNSLFTISESFLLKLDAQGNYNSVDVPSIATEKFLETRCFPNPANRTIILENSSKESAVLKIYDANGQLIVCDFSYLSGSPIQIETLPIGLYFYTINLKNGVGSGKFVKE